MKQTNSAIKFLMAQYRAIFNNAYFKGLATAAVATLALAAGQAQAADTITLGNTAENAVEINVTEGNKSATADGTNKFAKFVKVQKGATLNLSGSVTSLGNAEINGGTLTVNQSGGAGSLSLGAIKDFGSDKSKQAYEFDLIATAGSTLKLNAANIGLKGFDITGSTISLTSGGAGGTNLTAYGEGAYQKDGNPANLSYKALGKLTDVTANLEGGTNITAIGHLDIKGSALDKSVINLKGIESGDSSTHSLNLAYLGGSKVLTIDTTTINVKEGTNKDNSKGTAVVSPDLNISNSKINIAGENDQLTLGGLIDRNSAGGASNLNTDSYSAGTVVLNKTDITLGNAGSVLNLGHGEHTKTDVSITGGTIENNGTVNLYAPTLSIEATHFDALIKGKLDVKNNAEINIAGDVDFSKALTTAGALENNSKLILQAGKTLKVKSDDAVTLGSAFAQDKLTVEAGTLKVAAGAAFNQTSGTLIVNNALTTADGKDLTKFTISGTGSAVNLDLGKDASANGSVTKIAEIEVKGASQDNKGTLNVNGSWNLDATKLTVGESGAAVLNDATVSVKGFDIQANSSLSLTNSTLSTTGDVKSVENLITLADNSTLKVAYDKVVESSNTAKAGTLAAVSGDGTSTVVLTGKQNLELTLDQVNTLKTSFVGAAGKALFKIDGVTIKDTNISGSTVTYNQAQSGAGLADVYDKVTVTGVDTSSSAITSSNDWGAAQLAEGKDTLNIGAAGTVTLNGVDGKLVTKSDGKTAASVQVSGAGSTLNVVGTGTIESIAVGATNNGKVLVGEGATLTINKDIGTDTSAILGELNIQDKGALNVANAYVKTLTVDGALKATGDVKVTDTTITNISGSLEVLGEGKSFATSGAVSVAGSLKATALKLDSTDKQISVGNDDSTGFLEVGSLNLNGGKLLLDPAWGEKASLAFVDKSDTDTVNVNGSVGVGQNAAFFGGLASDSAAAQSILDRYTNASGSLDKNGVGALFVVNQSYDVASGKAVIVNPALEGAALESAVKGSNTFDLKKGAALVVTDELTTAIANKAGKAVINFAGQNGALTLEAGSSVVFDSALTADDKVNLVSGGGTPTVKNNGANITAANGLLLGAVTDKTVGFTLQEDKVRALSNMSRPVQDLVIDSLKTGSTFDKDADGAQYIISVNGHQDGKTLEATSRLAVYAGAVQGTALAQQAASDAVADRMSRANPNGSLVFANNAQGGGLWLSPIYKSHESDSFDADGVDYGVDGDLTGLVLGADSTTESGVRVGGYFNFGSASFDGQGVGDQVSNDADYFGFGLYAGMTAGQFSLLADAGFTQVSNDIEQNIGYKNLSKATADVDSSAVTLGLRGEYKLNLASVDVTPHLGVRYTRLAIDSYDTKINGYQVASTDFDTMQMFSIPFGVTVSKDIAAGAWAIKPVFDLTLTANAGDTDAKLSTYYTGTRALDLTSEAFDSFTYGATVGVDAKYGENFSIGLNTNYTGSSNADEFGVMGNVRYMF